MQLLQYGSTSDKIAGLFDVWPSGAKNWLTSTTEGAAPCEAMEELVDDRPDKHDDCAAVGDRNRKVKCWVNKFEGGADKQEDEEETEGEEQPDFTKEEFRSNFSFSSFE